jgi:serine/threonine-protein kinase PknK
MVARSPKPPQPDAKFEILGRAGNGRFGEVLRARRCDDGVLVALKITHEARSRQLLAREAAHSSLALSPLLPELVDVGWLLLDGTIGTLAEEATAGAVPCVALTWVDGVLLSEAQRQTREAAHRCDLALRLARDVGEALSDLHAIGLAHGDIKPDNLIVDSAGRIHIIDLGLACDLHEREIEGASPRYLALGDADLGDGRARDLAALGAVLAELVDGDVASSGTPVSAARTAVLPEPLRSICAALLAPQPGARPTAAWAADTASAALATHACESTADSLRKTERNVRHVRAAYLRLRRAETLAATSVRGDTAPWLLEAVEQSRRARSIAGEAPQIAAASLGPMDPNQLARWLITLAGSSAASWAVEPILSIGESAAARALASLAGRVPPSMWTLLDLEAALGSSSSVIASNRATSPIPWGNELDVEQATELALAMGRVPPDARALETIERCPTAPTALLLAAVRALTLRGEHGRARSLVLRGIAVAAKEVDPLAAEVLRRAGDFGLASERARAALERDADPDGIARAALARMTLDAGHIEEALHLTKGAPATAALCEVGAIIAVAQGEPQRAAAEVARGEAFAKTPEEHARLAGMRAYVSHGRDPEYSLKAYSMAAEHAARAGAVAEEGIYLLGLAGAAVDCGDLTLGIDASKRAALLGEFLERPPLVARAVLAGAVAHATVGASHDAIRLSHEAIVWARRASDVHAEAYAYWAIADASPRSSPEAISAAERAATLLASSNITDRLRAYARVLLHKPGSLGAARILELDAAENDASASSASKLEWWGARAADISLHMAAGEGATDAAGFVLSRIAALANARAEIAARGPALAAGAELAARVGNGEMARNLQTILASTAAELLRRAPPAFVDSARMLPWVVGAVATTEPGLEPQQSRELEAIVRALSERERLKDLLVQVVDSLVLWTGVERGLLLLRAPDGRLVPRAARNLARADLHGDQLALSQTLSRQALERREPIVATDAAGDLESFHRSAIALKLRSVLAVPLIARGEALGVVYLDDRVRRGAFGPRELGWVRTIASLASFAIADARAQVLLRRAARRASRASRSLGETLAQREAALDVAERELASVRGSRTRFSYDELVGVSQPMVEMLQIVDRVTATSIPALILGESGSGKELIARAIHKNGPRSAGPFVSENCGAIPEGLLESALFGHARGAFTGADRARVGFFEIAHGGTLFLDEIGEMSLTMQVKLLRILEDGLVHPIGSERARKVDVRIVAATHRDLQAMVRARQFREDLFFRLNIISIRVPPLRERASDIPLIVRHMLRKHGTGANISMTRAAMDRLTAYDWPGNVRQLENEIRRTIVLSDGTIDVPHLSPEISASPRKDMGLNVREHVNTLEAELVRQAMQSAGGNQTRAAKLLGLSRFGLQKMMKRLGLPSSTLRFKTN